LIDLSEDVDEVSKIHPISKGNYTANVYRELQRLCGEIGVQGFQIYGDCMYTRNPCNFEISTLCFPL
jgi:hypothetical protein